MDTKALKKQMGAAIAMVLVAAVALGSATFAWFVTNNHVEATTSTISAQSNAAFMYIREKNTDNTDSTTWTSTVDSAVNDKALYPAHWALDAESGDQKSYANANKFYTAFGTSASDGTMKGTATVIDDGTPAKAVAGKYAVENTFLIGSKGAVLKDLVVSGATFGTSGNTNFDKSLRALVYCGNNWVLLGKADSGSTNILASSSDDNKIADTVSSDPGQNIEVKVYLFYDGDVKDEIYTNNLDNLKNASKSMTISFDATSTTTDATNASTGD